MESGRARDGRDTGRGLDEGALARTRRLVDALRDPRCAVLSTGPVELIETHVSLLLLTGERVFKLKKPLRFDFLDFTTLEARRRACEDELRLNRRTAAELYLRVVAFTGGIEAPRLVPALECERDAVLEYAVEMRQFDPEALLAKRVGEGRIDGATVDRFADCVADFHARIAPARERTNAAAVARRNLDELRRLPLAETESARLARVGEWVEAHCASLGSLLAERSAAGFVRELHGDLHLSNVALIDERPVLFDCLEFDVALRTIDVIDEIAFGFMDFCALGRADLGHRFVNRYLERTGDYAGGVLLPFFAVHRALVRAKVAAIRSADAELARHLDVACALVDPPRPQLILTHGLAGSGKTTVSSALVEALGAIRIRSDVERKRQAGLAATARSGSPIGGGLYDAQGSEQTYRRLAEHAAALLAAGQSVVVDAAFLARAERARFGAIARAGGFGFWLVVCEAPVAVLRARIAARQEAGRDASEADAAVLDHQLAHAEPPDEGERGHVFVVATDAGPPALDEAVRRLKRRIDDDRRLGRG